MSPSTEYATIWIVRKGNGQVRASPSPCPVQGSFRIHNISGVGPVSVTFREHVVEPPEQTIPPGEFRTFTVSGGLTEPRYVEYGAAAGGFSVEGGSSPGIIIIP